MTHPNDYARDALLLVVLEHVLDWLSVAYGSRSPAVQHYAANIHAVSSRRAEILPACDFLALVQELVNTAPVLDTDAQRQSLSEALVDLMELHVAQPHTEVVGV